MALELDHVVYDCIYLAAAEREAAVLVTADRDFAAKAKATQYRISIVELPDWRTVLTASP
jgi:predicted nucleic acid-binding protein